MKDTDDNSNLYDALREHFRTHPKRAFDAQSLYDLPHIRSIAPSANRVSDYVGNLWRKELLTRTAAPLGTGTRSRWLYQWKGPNPIGPMVESGKFSGTARKILEKPSIEITEHGDSIHIEMLNLSISIKIKNK